MELKIVFSEDGTPPARPSAPPPDSLPSQSGNQPEQSQPSSPPPGPVARPSATPSGPPATPSASTLSAAEAAELFEKFGLKPEQIGARVAGDDSGGAGPEPAADSPAGPSSRPKRRKARPDDDVDADLEARLAHQDEMHDILSPDDEPPQKRRRRPSSEPGAGPEANGARDPFAGARAGDEPEAPPLPGERPPPPPKPNKPGPEAKPDFFHKAFSAAASQGLGAIAGEVGSAAGPGAGALASSLASSIGAVATASGPAAIALGTLAVGAGALAVGFSVLTNEVDKLKMLSGDVAGAVAANEARQQILMLRRAETIGPDLARFEKARGDINADLTEVMTQTTRVLLQLFQMLEDAGVVEFTRDALQYAAAQGEVMTEGLQFIKAIYDRDAPAIAREWAEVRAAMDKQNKAQMEFFRDSRDDKFDSADPMVGMLQRQLTNINSGLQAGQALNAVRAFSRRAAAFHGRTP